MDYGFKHLPDYFERRAVAEFDQIGNFTDAPAKHTLSVLRSLDREDVAHLSQ